MALVALTQYTDMIRALGEGSRANTILLPALSERRGRSDVADPRWHPHRRRRPAFQRDRRDAPPGGWASESNREVGPGGG